MSRGRFCAQASTDEEKRVRERLEEYIAVLEEHMHDKEKAKQGLSLLTEDPNEAKLDMKTLERKYRVRDMPLFIKSFSVLLGTVALFFLHPFISSIQLSIPWIAILGALLLLVRRRGSKLLENCDDTRGSFF